MFPILRIEKLGSKSGVLTKIMDWEIFAYPYKASRAAFIYSATITCGSSAGLDHDKEEREHISRLGTDALTTTTTSSGPCGVPAGSHYAQIQVAARPMLASLVPGPC